MSEHLWSDVISKGARRSEYTCSCGFQVTLDGAHEPVLTAPQALEQHRRLVEIRAWIAEFAA